MRKTKPAKKTAKPAKTAKKTAAVTAKRAKPAKKEEPKPAVYFAPPQPQLSDVPTYPVVNAKCKRGSDKMSEGQSCASLTAENMTPPGSTSVVFRCTKCKYSWKVPVGGVFQGL